MTDDRQIALRRGRVNLTGLSDEKLRDVISDYINHFLEKIGDSSIVIPQVAKLDSAPEGDIVIDDGALLLAMGGSYQQIYPASEVGSEGSVGGDVHDLIFPNPARVVKWTAFEGNYVTATNQTQLVIGSVANKYLAIVWLGVNNANTATDQLLHFQHEDLTPNLFRMSVPKGGGTVVHNFIGSPVIGYDVGKKFNIVIAEDLGATNNVNVTVGYVELDADFVAFDQVPVRREQGNTSEPY